MAQYNFGGIKDTPSQPKQTIRPAPTTKMATGSPEGEYFTHDAVMSAIWESNEEISGQLDTKSTSIQSSPSKFETALSTLADQVEKSEGLVSAIEDNIKDTTSRNTGLTLFAYSISLKKLKIVTQLDCWRESYQKSPPSFGWHTTWENTPASIGDAPRPRPTIVKLLSVKNKEKMMHLARQN